MRKCLVIAMGGMDRGKRHIRVVPCAASLPDRRKGSNMQHWRYTQGAWDLQSLSQLCRTMFPVLFLMVSLRAFCME